MENIHQVGPLIYKKADHNVPDNYRKVTVMTCIGKSLESVLNNRLFFKNDVCNDNEPFQAGFRSNSRTTDNIFILCAIIDKQRCLSKPLYTCFADFTRAFDYIDRSALYYKLLSRGIDGNLLNVIKSMLSKAESRVKWDSCISEILKRNLVSCKVVCSAPNYLQNFFRIYPNHLIKVKVSQ